MTHGESGERSDQAPSLKCVKCGAMRSDWNPLCPSCGNPVLTKQEAERNELSHIPYVVEQIEVWKRRAILTPPQAERLNQESVLRQDYLQTSLKEIAETTPPASRSQFDISGGAAPAYLYSAPQILSTPAIIPTRKSADFSVPSASESVLNVPERPSTTLFPQTFSVHDRTEQEEKKDSKKDDDKEPGVLQRHGMKLLFALATLLTLIAIRGLIAWHEFGEIAIRCVPAIPIALTFMFWRFGVRTRQENDWASFVYRAFACGLLAFDLLAINRYWIGAFGSPAPFKSVFLAGVSLSAITAGISFKKRKELPSLHLFMSCATIALFAALQEIRTLIWHFEGFLPTPLPLFGIAFLLLAGVSLFMSKASKEDKNALPEIASFWSSAWALWAHLGVASVVLFAAVDFAFQTGDLRSELALVALLAGLMYAVGAQTLEESGFVLPASLLFLASMSIGTIRTQRFQWTTFDLLSLTLALFSLCLARYDEKLKSVADEALKSAWLRTGQAALAVSGGLAVLMTLLFVLSPMTPANLSEARIALGISLVAGGSGWLLAVWRSERNWGFAALVQWGFALVAALFCLRAEPWAYGLGLLVYSSLPALGATLLERLPSASTFSKALARSSFDWAELLKEGGLFISLLSAIVCLLTSAFYQKPASTTFGFYFATLCGSFALFALNAWRGRSLLSVLGSLAITILTGVFILISSGSGVPSVGIYWTCFSLVSAGIVLALAFRLKEAELSVLGFLVWISGFGLNFYLLNGFSTLERSHGGLSDILWIAGGLASLPFLVQLSRSLQSASPARIACLALAGLCLRTTVLLRHPPIENLALWLLPLFALMYVAGKWVSEEEEAFLGKPTRNAAVAFSILFLALSVLLSCGFASNSGFGFGENGVGTPAQSEHFKNLLSVTLAAYSLCYAALFGSARNQSSFTLFSLTLNALILHLFLAQTLLWKQAGMPPLSWELFSLCVAFTGLFWAGVLWLTQRFDAKGDAFKTIPLLLSGGSALAGAGVAWLASFSSKTDMNIVYLDFGVAGSVWLALHGIEKKPILMHLGLWKFLAIWAMIISHKMSHEFALWDVYAIPFGLYILFCGHLQDRASDPSAARLLWSAGVAAFLLPGLCDYWGNSPQWHTLLFICECIAAALIGISFRIRAYAVTGLGFLAAFAASILVRNLAGYGVTLLALFAGVSLFVGGYYALTQKDRMQALRFWFDEKLQLWRAWR